MLSGVPCGSDLPDAGAINAINTFFSQPITDETGRRHSDGADEHEAAAEGASPTSITRNNLKMHYSDKSGRVAIAGEESCCAKRIGNTCGVNPELVIYRVGYTGYDPQ
ncbi:hypothetical protein PIB30_035321, partial [Stylosanthes scabra]|nr:hypothetical protein [Stylosanthes scabra]